MSLKEYHHSTRATLKGKWIRAILVTALANLLGGSLLSGGFEFSLEYSTQVSYSPSAQQIRWFLIVLLILMAIGIGLFILGSVIRMGYCKYLLNIVDAEEAYCRDLFSQFHRFGDGFVLRLKETLFIFLWSLLFAFPGLIAMYRYAMAPFLLYEHPEITAGMAIQRSKEMMQGRKWKLFLLDLSIYGPMVLLLSVIIFCAFITMIITDLSLIASIISIILLFLLGILLAASSCTINAYHATARAVFYRRICPKPQTEKNSTGD